MRLKSDDPNAHYNLGIALKNKGDLDGAIAEYRETLRLNADHPEAHNNLGIALRSKGDLDGAIAEYRLALRLKPDFPEAHNNLGSALIGKGDLDGAIAEYRQALRLNPDYPEPHNNLGIALKGKGDLDGAVAEYRRALRLKPNLAEAHYNLGTILRDRGDLDGAIAEYREALRLRPNYPLAHKDLGVALRDKGDLDGAIAEYRHALRLRPDYPEALHNLGAALRAKDLGTMTPPELPLSDVVAEPKVVVLAEEVRDEPHQPLSTARAQNLPGVQILSSSPAPLPGGPVPNRLDVPALKRRADQPLEKSSIQSLFETQAPRTRSDRPGKGRRIRVGLISLAAIVLVSLGSWLLVREVSSVRVQHQPSGGSSSATTPSTGTRLPSPATPPVVSKYSTPASVKAEPKAPSGELESKSAKRVQSSVRKLSPGERAKLKDKLVLAMFFMERNDYDGAAAAFEAALKIDPTNRDAKDGIRRVRKARDAQKANARP